MIQRASIIKILTIDYAACLAMMAIPLVWVVFFIFRASGDVPRDDWKLLAIFGAATLACIVVMLWRVNLIQTVFEDGWETEATISNVWFERDRGRVEYTYKFGEVVYKTGNAVMKAWLSRVQRVGGTAAVLVDRNHPKRAFLRDLYLGGPDPALAPVRNDTGAGAVVTSEPENRIAFQGTLDRRGFFNAVALAHRPSRGQLIWRTGLVVMVFSIFAAGFIYNGGAIPQMSGLEWFRYLIRPVLVVIAGFAAIFEPLIEASITANRQWAARQRQNQMAGDLAAGTQVAGCVDWQGIHYAKSPGGTAFVPWSKFVRMRVEKHRFALVTGSGEVHAFPLSIFQNEGEWMKTALIAKMMIMPVER